MQSQQVEMARRCKKVNADMSSDNKLSKSKVNSLTLIFLFVSTVVLIFIDSGFINFAVDDEWKELLKNAPSLQSPQPISEEDHTKKENL